MKGEIYCLGCKGTLPEHYTKKASWRCPHCGSVEYDYGIRPYNKDIICPECKGMLNDVEGSISLFCKKCNIVWRV